METGITLIATHAMDCHPDRNGNDFTVSVGEKFTLDKIKKGLATLKPQSETAQYDVLEIPVFNIHRGFDFINRN